MGDSDPKWSGSYQKGTHQKGPRMYRNSLIHLGSYTRISLPRNPVRRIYELLQRAEPPKLLLLTELPVFTSHIYTHIYIHIHTNT